MFGYRTIDTPGSLTLLWGKPDTIKLITVVDGNQRIEMDLTTTYVQLRKKGIGSRPVGKKVKLSYADAQAEQTDCLIRAAVPREGSNSAMPITGWRSSLVRLLVPALLLDGFMWWVLGCVGGGRSGTTGSGRPKAKIDFKKMPNVTFDDVAGEDEAVEGLEEIREFLSGSEKFRAVGVKIPRGVFPCSPPGTGKTLLVKAVIGEADVFFLSMAASEFVETFVGMGASRVYDLFNRAKGDAPAIIFISEIDAIDCHHGSGTSDGHDEYEQVFNQLLVEMDGSDANINVILIVVINRPDVLDPALLHPGRFDRQVSVEALDTAGRTAIFEVHAQGKSLNGGVNLGLMVKRTPGPTGADLANVFNEAALPTVRSNTHLTGNRTLNEVIGRVIVSPQRHTRVMRDHEKRVTTYREVGHTLCAAIGTYSDPATKMAILPCGRVLGYMQVMPQGDKCSTIRNELLDQLIYAIGGRTVEGAIFRDPTTGASNDIEKATATVRKTVTGYDTVGAAGIAKFGTTESETVLGLNTTSHDLFEQVVVTADTEVRNLLDATRREAWGTLTCNHVVLDQFIEELLTRETLLEKDLGGIFEGVTKQPERSSWRSDESLSAAEAVPASDQVGGESDDSHGAGDSWGHNH